MRFSRVQINNFYNLKDVDLDLSSGSSLIVGPNGSGKSNIIKCVQGLVKLLTRNVQFPSGTWTVKESLDETFIKIRAGLNRKEANFFGQASCDVYLIRCDQSCEHDITIHLTYIKERLFR